MFHSYTKLSEPVQDLRGPFMLLSSTRHG